MYILKFTSLLLVMLVLMTSTSAQDTACSDLVESALQVATDVCTDISRNQICYGNQQIISLLADDFAERTFEKPGDIIDVAALESLQMSELQEPDLWGIALMKIQANLPDTIPGQNVSILLFGDVLIAQSADTDVTTAGEADHAMQSFIFQSGVGNVQCEQAPPHGILVQTPSGVGTVTLTINGVQIDMGSTAFLDAVPDDVMRVVMIDGEASLTIDDETILVVAGMQAQIPLDENGLADGSADVTTYAPEDFLTLPLAYLEEPIALPGSGEGDLVALDRAIFCFAGREEGLPCEDVFQMFTIVPDEFARNFSMEGEEGNTWNHVSGNVYDFSYEVNGTDDDGNPRVWRSELTIVSPDLITVELFDHLGESFPKWYYIAAEDVSE